MTTKTDCLKFLSLNLAKCSNWRNLQAARWPEDPRNARAAELLFHLSGEATDISDEQWKWLEPYFDPRDRLFYETVSPASRDVGFRSSPRTFEDYVDSVLAALAALVVTA